MILSRIVLPGLYCPEIAGKAVMLLGQKTENLIELFELNSDPETPGAGVALSYSFLASSDEPNPDPVPLGMLIEEAAVKFFSKKTV